MQQQEKVSATGWQCGVGHVRRCLCPCAAAAHKSCMRSTFLFPLHVCHIGNIINAGATATAAANYANQTNASLEPTSGLC